MFLLGKVNIDCRRKVTRKIRENGIKRKIAPSALNVLEGFGTNQNE